MPRRTRHHATRESRQHANRLGIGIVEQTPNGLVKIIGLFFMVEIAIAATFRTRLAFSVTIRAFDLRDVDETVQRFFRFLLVKNFHLIEKPQRILRTDGVSEEPLVEAYVTGSGTSLDEDVPTTKTGGATILFDPTTLAFGTDRSKSTRWTSISVQEPFDFFKR